MVAPSTAPSGPWTVPPVAAATSPTRNRTPGTVPQVPPDRVRLVVLFGGRSAEHDVSRISAASVLAAVDRDRYEVVPVGIERDGTWQLAGSVPEMLPSGARSLPVAGRALDP